MDSLYAQAPVWKLAQQINWEVVITLKQENRQVYQSAMGLFQNRAADHRSSQNSGGTQTEFAIWDTEGLPFSEDYPEPVRLVRSEEKVTRNHGRRGRLEFETTAHQWMWITNLDRQVFPVPVVRCLGHDRWKNENNGWNDLTQNWALKHGFLHACQHRPKVIAADEKPRPVPHHGLMAVTLILCVAFALSSAFCLLHSKISLSPEPARNRSPALPFALAVATADTGPGLNPDSHAHPDPPSGAACFDGLGAPFSDGVQATAIQPGRPSASRNRPCETPVLVQTPACPRNFRDLRARRAGSCEVPE